MHAIAVLNRLNQVSATFSMHSYILLANQLKNELQLVKKLKEYFSLNNTDSQESFIAMQYSNK